MFIAPRSSLPLCAGIGLRAAQHRALLLARPDIGWVEVRPEDHFGGGAPVALLSRVRRELPVSFHGVGASLGSADGLEPGHLNRLRDLVERIQPAMVSDHVAWNRVGSTYLPELLPMPMTDESLAVVSRNVDAMQTVLRRRIAVENPCSYIRFANSTMTEWEFMAELARRTGCLLICDLTSIAVSIHNHGWDAAAYLRGLPAEAVAEIHVSGHVRRVVRDGSTVLVGDRSAQVSADVWDLLYDALGQFGTVPVLVEREADLSALVTEAGHADAFIDQTRHALAA